MSKVDKDIAASQQRILDAGSDWAKCRELGPAKAKQAWRDFALRVQAELSYTRAVALDEAASGPQVDRSPDLQSQQHDQPTQSGDIVGWLRRRADQGYCAMPAKLTGEIADHIEVLQRDAGRYRFIRNGEQDVWCSSGDDLLTGDQLDSAIDAAQSREYSAC